MVLVHNGIMSLQIHPRRDLTVLNPATGLQNLVNNENLCTIRLVWLYSHEQFSKRPTDKDLKNVIQGILGD